MSAVSFALGISTAKRGNRSYLKQTLTSLLSGMTLSEEEDLVVIVSIADVRMKDRQVSLPPRTYKGQVRLLTPTHLRGTGRSPYSQPAALQLPFLHDNHCIISNFFLK